MRRAVVNQVGRIKPSLTSMLRGALRLPVHTLPVIKTTFLLPGIFIRSKETVNDGSVVAGYGKFLSRKDSRHHNYPDLVCPGKTPIAHKPSVFQIRSGSWTDSGVRHIRFAARQKHTSQPAFHKHPQPEISFVSYKKCKSSLQQILK